MKLYTGKAIRCSLVPLPLKIGKDVDLTKVIDLTDDKAFLSVEIKVE